MKKYLTLGLALLLTLATTAQSTTNKIAAKYARIINKAALQKHLTIIAGDAFEGRETGTEGQRKAAAYIEQHFKNIGAQPSTIGYQQLYPLHKDSLLNSTLSINNETFTYGTDYIARPELMPTTVNAATTQLVFAGYGITDNGYNDYDNLDVKGKTIIVFGGEPKKEGKYFINGQGPSEWSYNGPAKKLALAGKNGAAAVIFITASTETFSTRSIEVSKLTGYNFVSIQNTYIPHINITHATAKKVLGTDVFTALLAKAKAFEPFAGKQSLTATMALTYTKARSTINASNVIGVVPGTDKKDEYIFVTGHYDHLGMRNGKIYYGADDDGSGTVAVMLMAEAFAKAKAAGKGPRRTMVFMAVSGEEKGLWGSEYYSDHPIYSLDKTSVDLNIDMIGRNDTERLTADSNNYVYVVGHNKISSELPTINEAQNNATTKLVLDYKYDDPADPNRIYYRSDHYNFARKGVPVLFFYDGMLKADYHKPTDTVDKINWALYQKRAHMIFYTAWAMANRPNLLKRDKPLDQTEAE
jgi:hypothetical protein